MSAQRGVLSRSPDRFLGGGELLGLPVAVDVRGRGFESAVRDGFAWLRDVDQRSTGHHTRRCCVVAGRAVQSFAEWLRTVGAENFRIDLGGDVITAGAPEPGARWRVGIPHPWQTGRLCCVLSLTDHAVATSLATSLATTRAEHGEPGRRGLASVTVIAPDLATAATTAEIAMALGRDGIAWADAQPGCLVFAVTGDGFHQYSSGVGALLERA